MPTIEFYAKPENGTIKIPTQYKDLVTSVVKVILQEQKAPANNAIKPALQKKSDSLLVPSIATNGWRFSREDANER